MNKPGCDKFINISHDNDFGFCPVINKHVYLDPKVSECLCHFCHVVDGKRKIDHDIYFYDNSTLGFYSKDNAKLEAQKAKVLADDAAKPPKEIKDTGDHHWISSWSELDKLKAEIKEPCKQIETRKETAPQKPIKKKQGTTSLFSFK